MGEWHLSFNGVERLPIARWEQVLVPLVGPLTTTYGAWDGNWRDGFTRSVTLIGEHDAIPVKVAILQHNREDNETDLIVDTRLQVQLRNAAFAPRFALWQRLRDTLATLGYVDQSLQHPDTIIEDATKAGATDIVQRLRAQTRALLIDAAPRGSVSLRSLEPEDIEAVLAAHPHPAYVRSLTVAKCTFAGLPPSLGRYTDLRTVDFQETAFADIELVLGALAQPALVTRLDIIDSKLRAVPSALAALTALENLRLEELPADASLRGLSLPALQQLTVRGPRALRRADFEGFPKLAALFCQYGPLDDLDLDIIDVCPNLHRAYFDGTPFSNDEKKLTALIARWKTVSDIMPKPPRTAQTKAPRGKKKVRGAVAPLSPPASPPAPVLAPPRTFPKLPEPHAIVPAVELRPFFERLLASPTDDAPRLEMARYLSERGDNRGAHIERAVEIDALQRGGMTISQRLRFEDGTLRPGSALRFVEIRALLDSGLCRNAKRFEVGYHLDSSEIVEYIARAGALPHLQELVVSNMPVSDRAALALARDAVDLNELALIDFGDIGPRAGGGVTDSVVTEVAHSPRLPALRSINRVVEHRHSSDPGARDGIDTQTLTRADGTTVELIVSHWIYL